MIAVLSALLPIFLLIVLGWRLRAGRLISDDFWPPAEALTYYVLFPSLLLTNLAEAKLDGLPVIQLAGAQGLATLVMAAVAVALAGPARRAPFHLDGPAISSLFQGLVRPNTYVGLAAASALFGPPGVTLTAICVAMVVPLVNLLSVMALVHWAGGEAGNWRRMGALVVRNPLILACLIGTILNLSGIGSPPLIGPFLKILGQASLALGLLAVGAGLELRSLKATGPAVALAVTGKLLVLPLVITGTCILLGVGGLPLVVSAAYGALPVAPNAYVLARQLGGDSKLMAAIITMSTVVAAVTMPLLISVLSGVFVGH